MAETDILIIGGGPAGIVTAVTARKNNPSKRITLVRDKEREVIPCSIPYIFNRMGSVEESLVSDEPLEANKIDLLIGRATGIDTANKEVALKGGKKISYDKLVLATGSGPILIPIKGIDKKGVWHIKKDIQYLRELRQAVLKSRNIVIIGGGFIGVEVAEELSRIDGLNISIIERLDHCLIATFDEEFAVAAEEMLKHGGVRIHTKCTVNEIAGDNRVESVKLDNGKNIPADLVILSIGAKPNTNLAKDAGIRIGTCGGIWVDKHMRTDAPEVFAVGDCTETRDFFTGKPVPGMLASAAATAARIAGSNLYRTVDLKENRGMLFAFSTYVNGLVLGGTGITENRAKADGLDMVVGTSECPGHHPGTLPDTGSIRVKLIFSKSSKLLLGAQVMCPESTSEMTNTLALAIQKDTTVHDLSALQASTHPLLTASPTIYPLVMAAQSALAKMD